MALSPRYASSGSTSNDVAVATGVGAGSSRGCGSDSTLARPRARAPRSIAARSAVRAAGDSPKVSDVPGPACAGVAAPIVCDAARSGARSRTISAGGNGSSASSSAAAVASELAGAAGCGDDSRSAAGCGAVPPPASVPSSSFVGTHAIVGPRCSPVHPPARSYRHQLGRDGPRTGHPYGRHRKTGETAEEPKVPTVRCPFPRRDGGRWWKFQPSHDLLDGVDLARPRCG